MSTTRYGWYSTEQEKRGGSCLYTTPSGVEVLVTEVSDDPVMNNWPDRVPRGKVVEFVRRVSEPRWPYPLYAWEQYSPFRYVWVLR